MIFYGIRNKKTKIPLGISSCSNDGQDFCCDVSYMFEEDYDNIWLVSDIKYAEKVFKEKQEWYTAVYNSPQTSEELFKRLKHEFEIFEVDTTR